MYLAGLLEKKNIKEYEIAARLALQSGHPEFLQDLLSMAEVEWEHENYFRSKVLTSSLHLLLPLWDSPASKETLRATYSLDDWANL
jgi:hypothetical protein